MTEITQHITEACAIHRELLEQELQTVKDNKIDDKDLVNYQELQYVPHAQGSKIKIDSSINYYAKIHKNVKCAGQISNFLNNLEVQEAKDGLRGITWLELYILYRCRGHGKPIADPDTAAKARATPAKQIAKLKTEVKKMINHIGATSYEQ